MRRRPAAPPRRRTTATALAVGLAAETSVEDILATLTAAMIASVE